jgi:hypothetical protein
MTYVCFLLKCNKLRYKLEQACEQPCAHMHAWVCVHIRVCVGWWFWFQQFKQSNHFFLKEESYAYDSHEEEVSVKSRYYILVLSKFLLPNYLKYFQPTDWLTDYNS